MPALPRLAPATENSIRLATFIDWTDWAKVRPIFLARNGFLYTHDRDVVRCERCKRSQGDWEDGDDPEDGFHSARRIMTLNDLVTVQIRRAQTCSLCCR